MPDWDLVPGMGAEYDEDYAVPATQFFGRRATAVKFRPSSDYNLTFDGWKARGYSVIKGQKSTGRNREGKATFSRAQVTDSRQGNEDDLYEDDWMFQDPDIGDRW